jgi:3D-(3,5/4)-trihydroxycyclohexane-1,2-dione acylhydrolase (decyclizing)
MPGTGAGGHWWDVAVPEVSDRREVNEARKGYEDGQRAQWLVN